MASRIEDLKLTQPIRPRYINVTDRQTDGRTDGRLTVAIPRNAHSAIKTEKGKIGIKVFQGTRKWIAKCQIKRSTVKVTQQSSVMIFSYRRSEAPVAKEPSAN